MSDRSIGVVDILILYENAAMRGRDTHYAGGLHSPAISLYPYSYFWRKQQRQACNMRQNRLHKG